MNINNMEMIDLMISLYRESRAKHLKKNWLSFNAFYGRVRGKTSFFDQLRRKDFEFFNKIYSELKEKTRLSTLNKNELEEIALFLKNHRSLLGQRDYFLTVYAALFAVLLIFPKKDIRAWVTVCIVIVVSIVALIERWNMRQNDAIYNELAELIQTEIKKESANPLLHPIADKSGSG